MAKPPDAFLSYTRFDDEYHGGAISTFREQLSMAVRAVTAKSFEIFQDVDGIGVGETWGKRLNIALGEARFFIPILTPNYFESKACQEELRTFLQFEAASGRDDLILPIYWLRCRILEDPNERAAVPLAEIINNRQRSNWLKLRHKPHADPEVREALEALAEQIGQARGRMAEVTSAAPPTAPRPPDNRPAARLPESGTVFRDIDAPWCPQMVVIPPGEFMMGSSDAEREWAMAQGVSREWVDWEQPQHRVRIAYALAVGRYPVTFEEYDNFADATGRSRPKDQGWGRARRPVIEVSWDDAKAYVEWLAAATREPYRLLSEAEWEYVCRAGTTTRFWWGDDITLNNANYAKNIGNTSRVGTYPANPFGLCDTHGNVSEWCEDRWHDSYDGAPDDGSAWSQWARRGRVVRGGSWGSPPRNLRAACRNWVDTGGRGYALGFRLARMLAA